MRNLIIVFLLWGMAACAQVPRDHFVLRGNVPGAADSTRVVLSNSKQELITYIVNEKFEIQGKVEHPTYSTLRLESGMRRDRKIQRREIDFFVENGELQFSTPHVDSLPWAKGYQIMDFRKEERVSWPGSAIAPVYWLHNIRKEKNYTLIGSPAQDVYYRYQQQTIPYRYLQKALSDELKMNRSIELYQQLSQAETEWKRITGEVIESQNNLFVNLHLVEFLKEVPFGYDQAYLDNLRGLFSSYQDTCVQLQKFRKYLKEAEPFVVGKVLEDGEILAANGKNVSLLAQMNKKGYTVIDFWASWCSFCRAAFPHMKEVYKRYGTEIKFISLSLDREEKVWHRVREEEMLPWDDFYCKEQFALEVKKLYKINSIPRYFLIDPEGRLVFADSESFALELRLETLKK